MSGRLLLSELTKLCTVRRWMLALLAAPVLTVLAGLVVTSGSYPGSPDATVAGPDGSWVQDRFHFVHQPLTGDGTVTVRVESSALELSVPDSDGGAARTAEVARTVWSKAGLMLKDGVRPGAAYAAVMVVPGHGVRLQSNFTTDVAGPAAGAPTWLRLARHGSAVTAWQSGDGTAWTVVGTVTVPGLPATVEVGPFVASPAGFMLLERQFGHMRDGRYPTSTRAVFDRPVLQPAAGAGAGGWRDDEVNDEASAAPPPPGMAGIKGPQAGPPPATWSGDRLTLVGVGDIAPRPVPQDLVKDSLTGAYAGLLAIVAVAVLFVTSEYRRGMVRTTFAATPARGRVLLAKALVAGSVTFVAGLVAAVATLLVAGPILRRHGYGPPVYPVWSLTDPALVRAACGTAAALAAIAVFSLALGALLRRAAGAVATVIVLVLLPQLLASALPAAAGSWLLRLTPGAGFTVQQTVPRYGHVPRLCVPENGCLYDQPWTGFAVLCAYAVVTLGVAVWLLRRRDV